MKKKICEVKESPIHGNGLFALYDIKQGVWLFETHILDSGWVDSMPKNAIIKHSKKIPFLWINLNPHCMYNHSETEANCVSQTEGKRKILVAKRDIKVGEELLVDYTKDPDLEQPREIWNNE